MNQHERNRLREIAEWIEYEHPGASAELRKISDNDLLGKPDVIEYLVLGIFLGFILCFSIIKCIG